MALAFSDSEIMTRDSCCGRLKRPLDVTVVQHDMARSVDTGLRSQGGRFRRRREVRLHGSALRVGSRISQPESAMAEQRLTGSIDHPAKTFKIHRRFHLVTHVHARFASQAEASEADSRMNPEPRIEVRGLT